jgi:hypothetical protein
MLGYIAAFFSGFMIGLGVGGEQKNCPRQLLGWKHMNNHCDHSFKALAQAYTTLAENEDRYTKKEKR